ncbi:DUF1589 domain-containing protein [Rhodopirellula baltica]|uniref:DUF1589 domain-containing protein n=1 Tax=Rhodopirellula baltica TaxID=265606 RepID=UPI0009D92B41
MQSLSQEQPSPAKHPRQVQPGLQPRLVAGFARIRFTILVGHVPHGIHADALEQSETSSKRFRESNVHRQRTIARYNLAYRRRVYSPFGTGYLIALRIILARNVVDKSMSNLFAIASK